MIKVHLQKFGKLNRDRMLTWFPLEARDYAEMKPKEKADGIRSGGKNRSQNEGPLSKSSGDRIGGEKRTIPKAVAEKYLTIHRRSTSGHIVATTAGNPTRCRTLASTSHFRFAFQIPAGRSLRNRKRVTRRR